MIIGILTYVLLAAILGSLATRIEDINQTLMPLTLFAMIAFILRYSVCLNLTFY